MNRLLVLALACAVLTDVGAAERSLIFKAPPLPSQVPSAPASIPSPTSETLGDKPPVTPPKPKSTEPDLSGYDFADKIRLKAQKCMKQYVPLEEFANAMYPLVEKTMLIAQPKKPSLANLFSGDTVEYLPKEMAQCDSITWKAIAYDMLGLAEPPEEKSQDAEVPIPLELRKETGPEKATVKPVKPTGIPVGKPLETGKTSAKSALPPPLPR